MLSAKNKIVIAVFGVLAIIIFLMYLLDNSANKNVERFKDEEDDDIEDEENEQKPKPVETQEDEPVQKTKIVEEETFEDEVEGEGETHGETHSTTPELFDEPKNSSFTPSDKDVVTFVSKWLSSLNIPTSLKTETFKELFSEENIDRLKAMVSVQQAKDLVTDIMSSISGQKENFASTIKQRQMINGLKTSLKSMEKSLNELMTDLESTKTTPQTNSSTSLTTLPKVVAPTKSKTPATITLTPSANTTALARMRLPENEPLIAKNSNTTNSSLGTSSSNNVIEGFENVHHNFALF